jgi:hypothetical protein
MKNIIEKGDNFLRMLFNNNPSWLAQLHDSTYSVFR